MTLPDSFVLASGLNSTHLNDDGYRDLAVLRTLLHVVHSYNNDFMHAHEFYMNMVATLVSCMTGIAAVCTVHEVYRRAWDWCLPSSCAQRQQYRP